MRYPIQSLKGVYIGEDRVFWAQGFGEDHQSLGLRLMLQVFGVQGTVM